MGRNIAGILFFCVKFLIYLVPLVSLWWWLALPWYGEFLKQAAGGILKFGLGMNIESGDILLEGFLNTGSRLSFMVNGHEPAMPITQLVTNIPPYLALVLATPALGLWRRLRIMGYGFAILAACHVAFIVFALRIQEQHIDYSKIPTALGQFFLTLPFLLWIVFAYWERIMAAVNDSGSRNTPPGKEKKEA